MTWILFAAFCALFLLRVPVAFALILSSLLVIVLSDLPPNLMALRIFEGLSPFPILAVPLFFFLANLCNAGGFTDRIMTLARALVGRVRAGLAYVNIVDSMLFAGVSGSSTADTAGLGAVLMPQMLKAGYPASVTVALTACSSTLGNIIPPSIMMVIYGSFGNVSIGMLFLGGFIPGVLLGFVQMAFVWYLSRKHGWGADDFAGGGPRWPAVRRGVLPFGIPVIIIGGIVGGVFTPTESAAVAVFYALVLSFFIEKGFDWRAVVSSLREGGRFIGIPLIMTAGASVFAWLLAFDQFPDAMVKWMQAFGATQIGVLLAVVVLYLILGCFLDSIPAIIMFLPIVQALGDSVGIHPVHMGLVVVLTCALGLVTPPYGVCLLVACQIINIHPREAIPMTLMIGIASLAVILFVVFVPETVLFLPRLLMPKHF